MSDKKRLIAFAQSLIQITEEEAKLVLEGFEFRRFEKNEFILKEGEISRASYFIDKGICRSFVNDAEGIDATVQFFTSNMYATDFNSLFNKKRSLENIQAITEIDTWFIPLNVLEKEFHTKPLFREMGRALLVRKATALKALMLEAKKMSADQRYLKLLNETPEIIQFVPQRMIASFMGITESSLSRIKRTLV